jgi:hypothetical protein
LLFSLSAIEQARRIPLKKQNLRYRGGFANLYVGMTGFEPATPSSRTKYATGLRYIPKPVNGGQK